MPVTATRTGPRSLAAMLMRLWPSALARLRRAPGYSHAYLGEHQVDRLADRRHAFEIFFRHLDVEALLEAHHELDQVEAVGVEVLLEARGLGDRAGVHGEHFRGNLLDRREGVLTVHVGHAPSGCD